MNLQIKHHREDGNICCDEQIVFQTLNTMTEVELQLLHMKLFLLQDENPDIAKICHQEF